MNHLHYEDYKISFIVEQLYSRGFYNVEGKNKRELITILTKIKAKEA